MTSDDTVQDFSVVMRGYDRGEVDRHVRDTARTIADLREQVIALGRELEEQRAAAATAGPAPGQDASPSERFGALGEETTRILVAAEVSAREMRDKARRQAEGEVAAAERAARERVDTATQHAARIVGQAEHRRDEIAAATEQRRLAVEEEIARLEGVRADLVAALGAAVDATSAAVTELAPEEPSGVGAAAPEGDAIDEPAEDASEGSPDDATEEAVPDDDVVPPADALIVLDEQARAEPDSAAAAADAAADAAAAADSDADAAADADADDEQLVDDTDGDATGVPAPAATDDVDATDDVTDDAGEDDATEVGQDDPADHVAATGRRAGTRTGAAPAAVRSALAGASTAAATTAGMVVEELPAAVRRDRSLAGVRPGTLRRLRRGLQDLQNGVLQRIRERTDGDATTLLPGDDAEALVADVAAPFLDDANRAGTSDALVLVGADPGTGAADPGLAADAAAALAVDLLDELRTTLLPSLRAGIEAAEPDASLSERVGEVFRDLKGPVVETVSDRHLLRTYGLSTLAAWRQHGVERVTWELGEESRCPEGKCRTNAAEGPVAIGAAFPSGDAMPQVHDGCTCALAPSAGDRASA